MTERIRRLKEKLDALDDRAVWLERTALCREGYERYQWEPPLRQTAHLFAHMLENMAVVIDEDDLLVGRTQEVVPNAEQENYLAENARFSGTLGQWTLDERHREAAARAFSPRDVEVMEIYGTAPGGWRNGHTTPSWPRVVHRGFDWIKEEAAQRLTQRAGQTPEGRDACNDLSFLCLDAIEHLRLKQPTVIVRYHRNVNPAFFRRACEVIRLGTGHPAIFNDETMIPALLNVGIPMEDARDYAVVGCANPNIPGREPALNDHRLNVPKCLELALNNGVCQRTGRDTGVHTGRAEDFATFEDFLAAFYRHVDELVAWWVRRNDFFDCVTATCVCDPFLSSLVEGCLENARDGYAGGSIYFHNPYQAAGLATPSRFPPGP
jgi:pyruvate-formate lyase